MFVIAGVTGHVGSTAAKALLAKGEMIKVIVRDARKGGDWSKAGAEVAVGELGDTGFLTGVLRGAAGFFTLLPPDFTSADLYAAQRKLADAQAAAVKASGVQHVVLLSSIGADQATDNGPIKGLHYFEKALRATGATLSAIRAASFQENVHSSLAPARNAGIFPNLSLSADYPYPQIATKDIGALVAESLLHKPAKSEAVDLIGPSYSVRQVAEKLGAALGKKLQVVDVPQAGWTDAMLQGGVPRPMAEALTEMFIGFSTGKITPKGDRTVRGETAIEETLKAVVAG